MGLRVGRCAVSNNFCRKIVPRNASYRDAISLGKRAWLSPHHMALPCRSSNVVASNINSRAAFREGAHMLPQLHTHAGNVSHVAARVDFRMMCAGAWPVLSRPVLSVALRHFSAFECGPTSLFRISSMNLRLNRTLKLLNKQARTKNNHATRISNEKSTCEWR